MINSNNSSEMNGVAVLIAVFGVVVLVIYGGWVLQTLWNWFIPSIFDLPHLTIAQAIGISLVASNFSNPQKVEEGEGMPMIFRAIIKGLLLLATGFIVVQFI